MPVVSKLQSGFTSGELDPKLRARNDIAAYHNGAAKLRNVLVIPQGAAKRRPGLEYMGVLPGGDIKMIPFVFSDTAHYMCILTENLLTIYKDGISIATVACVISNAQVSNVTWAQSYDTLLLFHREFTPQAFIRQTETTWVNSAWTLINIPTRNFGLSETATLTIKDHSSANIDFSDWGTGNTETDAIFTAGTSTFSVGDVGRYIRAGGGYARITAYNSDTEVICDILTAFTNDHKDDSTHYAGEEWGIEEKVWSTARGYPSCGTFFQGRLYVANTADLPNTVWGSIVNNENNFQNWIPEYADNGLEVSAGGGLMSNFNRLHSGQHLIALADNGEYYIPSSKDEPITPTNVSLVRNSSQGSVNLPTFEIDSAVIYMRDGGKSLIEAKYNFADGSYNNKDLSLLSSHLLNDPKAMAYRKQTNTDEADYVLVVNGDGTLAVLCTLRVQEVTAWTVCHTAGSFISCMVDGSVMYFTVERTIAGTPVRTLERFNEDLVLDCATLDQTGGITVVTNLSYLDGQDVSIVLDNTVQPSQTVVGGQITLAHEGDDAQVGIQFPVVDTDSESRVYVELMPIEVDIATGSSVGKQKRVIEVTVLLYDTSHIEVRKNKVPIRRIGIDDLDNPVPKRSENLTIYGLLGWDNKITISIGQTIPLPMQLLGVAYRVRI